MDKKIIENHNKTVAPKDVVYFLGDFAFRAKFEKLKDLWGSLSGKFHVIFGNHDTTNLQDNVAELNLAFPGKFLSWGHYKEIKIENQGIVLFHYPLVTWNKRKYGNWMLHGHSHGNLEGSSKHGAQKIFDVGVDTNDFFPYPFEEIKSIMDKRIG